MIAVIAISAGVKAKVTKHNTPIRLPASFFVILGGLLGESLVSGLGALLTYSKHLRSTPRAYTLSRTTFVLHYDRLWIPDLDLPSAFHTICLHFDLLALKICF
jgi:hypothetical protein